MIKRLGGICSCPKAKTRSVIMKKKKKTPNYAKAFHVLVLNWQSCHADFQ